MDQQWRQICETWKYVMAMKPEVRGSVEPGGISFIKSLVGWFLPENLKTWKQAQASLFAQFFLAGQKLFQAQSITFCFSFSVFIVMHWRPVSCSVFCFRLGQKVTCQDVRQGDGPEGEGVRKRRWWGGEGKSDGRSSGNPERILILILIRREWWALNRGRRFEVQGSDLPLLPPSPAGSGRGRGE